MLTRAYIEALLVDPEAADRIWESWSSGDVPDEVAALAWCVLVTTERMRGERSRIDE